MLVEQADVHRQPLEGDRPAVPVRTIGLIPDGGDQALPERLPVALEAGLDNGGAQPEHARLPRGVEDELPVAAGRSGGAVDVEQVAVQSRATPIIESRVTRCARSSSERSSVPSGRSGTTR